MRTYYVYIMASRSRVLYTGVTNDLGRLVYFEEFGDVRDAIAREKQLKGWVRVRKIRLIEERNPTWEDLADRWFWNDRVHDDPHLSSQSDPRLVILSERAERARAKDLFADGTASRA